MRKICDCVEWSFLEVIIRISLKLSAFSHAVHFHIASYSILINRMPGTKVHYGLGGGGGEGGIIFNFYLNYMYKNKILKLKLIILGLPQKCIKKKKKRPQKPINT